MIRDLGHVVDREKAKIGVFITLAEPTKPMQRKRSKLAITKRHTARFQNFSFSRLPSPLKARSLTFRWLTLRKYRKNHLRRTDATARGGR
jgi:hypothetical protein